jgi:hypothetical protein
MKFKTGEVAYGSTVSAWMITHTRATDIVYFGPFDTFKEAYDWWVATGKAARVQPCFNPMISPSTAPELLWEDPVFDHAISD